MVFQEPLLHIWPLINVKGLITCPVSPGKTSAALVVALARVENPAGPGSRFTAMGLVGLSKGVESGADWRDRWAHGWRGRPSASEPTGMYSRRVSI